MNINELIQLISAGFTKDEILKLFAGDAQQAPQADAPQADASQAETKPASVDELNAYTARIVELENENNELRKANQTLALLRDSAPQPMNNENLQSQAMDALASIIKPTILEQGGIK